MRRVARLAATGPRPLIGRKPCRSASELASRRPTAERSRLWVGVQVLVGVGCCVDGGSWGWRAAGAGAREEAAWTALSCDGVRLAGVQAQKRKGKLLIPRS